MKRVALYARCSTDNQLEAQYNSIDSQIDTLHHYLQVHKDEWAKCKEYRDEGISGKSIDQRPGLNRLLMDAKSHEFDILLVRCKEGIVFSKSKPKVHTVFVIIGTRDERNFHLYALSAIAQVIQSPGSEKKWLSARTSHALRDVVLLGERKRHIT